MGHLRRQQHRSLGGGGSCPGIGRTRRLGGEQLGRSEFPRHATGSDATHGGGGGGRGGLGAERDPEPLVSDRLQRRRTETVGGALACPGGPSFAPGRGGCGVAWLAPFTRPAPDPPRGGFCLGKPEQKRGWESYGTLRSFVGGEGRVGGEREGRGEDCRVFPGRL